MVCPRHRRPGPRSGPRSVSAARSRAVEQPASGWLRPRAGEAHIAVRGLTAAGRSGIGVIWGCATGGLQGNHQAQHAAGKQDLGRTMDLARSSFIPVPAIPRSSVPDPSVLAWWGPGWTSVARTFGWLEKENPAGRRVQGARCSYRRGRLGRSHQPRKERFLGGTPSPLIAHDRPFPCCRAG